MHPDRKEYEPKRKTSYLSYGLLTGLIALGLQDTASAQTIEIQNLLRQTVTTGELYNDMFLTTAHSFSIGEIINGYNAGTIKFHSPAFLNLDSRGFSVEGLISVDYRNTNSRYISFTLNRPSSNQALNLPLVNLPPVLDINNVYFGRGDGTEVNIREFREGDSGAILYDRTSGILGIGIQGVRNPGSQEVVGIRIIPLHNYSARSLEIVLSTGEIKTTFQSINLKGVNIIDNEIILDFGGQELQFTLDQLFNLAFPDNTRIFDPSTFYGSLGFDLREGRPLDSVAIRRIADLIRLTNSYSIEPLSLDTN